MEQDLVLAGWRSLAYATVFGQGLSKGEVFRFLISPHNYSMSGVRVLWKDWSARGLVKPRPRPNQHTHWKQALAVRGLAQCVPWVQSIWVTGSLAAGTANDEDDIDFLIITDANRLWLSRLLLVGVSVLLGRARTRQMSETRVRDRWCFNMWLEPEKTKIDEAQQSLYIAREVIQAVPLYVRRGVRAEQFLENNVWVKHYFATGWGKAVARAKRAPHFAPLFSFSTPLFSWLNESAWLWQKKRILSSKTREVVEKNQALFHPRNTRMSVKEEYERICTLLQLTPYA